MSSILLILLVSASAFGADKAPKATSTPPPNTEKTKPAKAPPSVKELAARIKRACEKNIESPKKVGERMKVCACIARNHETSSDPEDLVVIESIYGKTFKATEPIDDNVSILLDFDISVAEECLKNPNYKVEKPED